MNTQTPQSFTPSLHIPPFEEREVFRQSWDFKSFLEPWNRGYNNSTKKVGALMSTLKQLYNQNPTLTRDEWAEYYLSNIRSTQQISALMNDFANAACIPFEKAALIWWIHVIDSSFTGMQTELKIFVMLQSAAVQKGYTARFSQGIEDEKMGVDIVVEDNSGTVLAGFQVKPNSYFLSLKPTVVEARAYNQKKYQLFREANPGSSVWYINQDLSLQQGMLIWRKV